MYTQKQIEKYKRTKYTRELERFLNRTVSYFQKGDISSESFTLLRDRIFEPLENIEKVDLLGTYQKAMESFVERTANLPESGLDIEEIEKRVLHEANHLQMIKRKKNFNKEKHKKRSIENEERHY